MPKILKVKITEDDNDKKFNKLHPHLLKPPFLGIIQGSVRCGKSNLIMNIIYNKNFYKNYFDKVIFISPTSLNDKTLHHLADDDDIVKINDNLENLDEILKTIVEEKAEDEEEIKKHWLLLLDDCLGYVKHKSYLSYLCTRYRHYKISLLITSQSFRSIGNIIRTNATFYLLFKSNNKKEINKFDEEFSSLFKHFMQCYEEATSKPYNFLYVDLRNLKLYQNFENLLDTKKEDD